MYIDLLQIQRFSFLKFLKNGINQVFDNINPIIIANRKYIFFSKYYLLKIPSQIDFVSINNQFKPLEIFDEPSNSLKNKGLSSHSSSAPAGILSENQSCITSFQTPKKVSLSENQFQGINQRNNSYYSQGRYAGYFNCLNILKYRDPKDLNKNRAAGIKTNRCFLRTGESKYQSNSITPRKTLSNLNNPPLQGAASNFFFTDYKEKQNHLYEHAHTRPAWSLQRLEKKQWPVLEKAINRPSTNLNRSNLAQITGSSHLTYSSEFYIPVQIIDQISKKMYLRWLLLADLPIQTKRGHFIINGYPKTVIHQIVRSPGIRFKNEDNQILADIISMRGAWMGIQIVYEKNPGRGRAATLGLKNGRPARTNKIINNSMPPAQPLMKGFYNPSKREEHDKNLGSLSSLRLEWNDSQSLSYINENNNPFNNSAEIPAGAESNRLYDNNSRHCRNFFLKASRYPYQASFLQNVIIKSEKINYLPSPTLNLLETVAQRAKYENKVLEPLKHWPATFFNPPLQGGSPSGPLNCNFGHGPTVNKNYGYLEKQNPLAIKKILHIKKILQKPNLQQNKNQFWSSFRFGFIPNLVCSKINKMWESMSCYPIKESEKIDEALSIHFFISSSRTDKTDKKKIKLSGFAFLDYLFDHPYFIYNNYIPSWQRSSFFPASVFVSPLRGDTNTNQLNSSDQFEFLPLRRGFDELSQNRKFSNLSFFSPGATRFKRPLRETDLVSKKVWPVSAPAAGRTEGQTRGADYCYQKINSSRFFINKHMENQQNYPLYFTTNDTLLKTLTWRLLKKIKHTRFSKIYPCLIQNPALQIYPLLNDFSLHTNNLWLDKKVDQSFIGNTNPNQHTSNHKSFIRRSTPRRSTPYPSMYKKSLQGWNAIKDKQRPQGWSKTNSLLDNQNLMLESSGLNSGYKPYYNPFGREKNLLFKLPISPENYTRSQPTRIKSSREILREKFIHRFSYLPFVNQNANLNIPAYKSITWQPHGTDQHEYFYNKLDNQFEKAISSNRLLTGLVGILNTTNFRDVLFERFMNPKFYDIGLMGRKRLNKKLRLNIPLQCTTLTPLDFLAIFYKLFSLYNNFSLIQNFFPTENLLPLKIPFLGDSFANSPKANPLSDESSERNRSSGSATLQELMSINQNPATLVTASPGIGNVFKSKHYLLDSTLKQTGSLDHLNQRHIRTSGEFLFLQFWRAILRFYQVLSQLSNRSNFIKSSYTAAGKTPRNFFSLSSISLFPSNKSAPAGVGEEIEYMIPISNHQTHVLKAYGYFNLTNPSDDSFNFNAYQYQCFQNTISGEFVVNYNNTNLLPFKTTETSVNNFRRETLNRVINRNDVNSILPYTPYFQQGRETAQKKLSTCVQLQNSRSFICRQPRWGGLKQRDSAYTRDSEISAPVTHQDNIDNNQNFYIKSMVHNFILTTPSYFMENRKKIKQFPAARPFLAAPAGKTLDTTLDWSRGDFKNHSFQHSRIRGGYRFNSNSRVIRKVPKALQVKKQTLSIPPRGEYNFGSLFLIRAYKSIGGKFTRLQNLVSNLDKPVFNSKIETVIKKLLYETKELRVFDAKERMRNVETKLFNGVFKEFFNLDPLSQDLDETNGLSEIIHKRRISALGKGGVTSKNAPLSIRSIHPSFYGRLCPIDSPEGDRVGLINSLTNYARINSTGYIATPFYRTRVNLDQEPYVKSATEKFLLNINPLLAQGTTTQTGIKSTLQMRICPPVAFFGKISAEAEPNNPRCATVSQIILNIGSTKKTRTYKRFMKRSALTQGPSTIPGFTNPEIHRVSGLGKKSSNRAVGNPFLYRFTHKSFPSTKIDDFREKKEPMPSFPLTKTQQRGLTSNFSGKRLPRNSKPRSASCWINPTERASGFLPCGHGNNSSASRKLELFLWYDTHYMTPPITHRETIINNAKDKNLGVVYTPFLTCYFDFISFQGYAPITAFQFFSPGVGLIPFLEHDDGTRALMGANMQRQAVPLISAELPIVGTGLEKNIAAGFIISSTKSGYLYYISGKQSKQIFRRVSRSVAVKKPTPVNQPRVKTVKPSTRRQEELVNYRVKPCTRISKTQPGLVNRYQTSPVLKAGAEIPNKKLSVPAGGGEKRLIEVSLLTVGIENPKPYMYLFKQHPYFFSTTRTRSGCFFNRLPKQQLKKNNNLVSSPGRVKRTLSLAGAFSTRLAFPRQGADTRVNLDLLFSKIKPKQVPTVLHNDKVKLGNTLTHKTRIERFGATRKAEFRHSVDPWRGGHFILNTHWLPYRKSYKATIINKKPAIPSNSWLQKGDLLVDGTSSINGELALGRNLFSIYMPWEGYNFEDAILISDKAAQSYTTIHVEEFSVKISKNEFVSSVVKPFTWVNLGDILVLKKRKLENEFIMNRLLFGMSGKPKVNRPEGRSPSWDTDSVFDTYLNYNFYGDQLVKNSQGELIVSPMFRRESGFPKKNTAGIYRNNLPLRRFSRFNQYVNKDSENLIPISNPLNKDGQPQLGNQNPSRNRWIDSRGLKINSTVFLNCFDNLQWRILFYPQFLYMNSLIDDPVMMVCEILKKQPFSAKMFSHQYRNTKNSTQLPGQNDFASAGNIHSFNRSNLKPSRTAKSRKGEIDQLNTVLACQVLQRNFHGNPKPTAGLQPFFYYQCEQNRLNSYGDLNKTRISISPRANPRGTEIHSNSSFNFSMGLNTRTGGDDYSLHKTSELDGFTDNVTISTDTSYIISQSAVTDHWGDKDTVTTSPRATFTRGPRGLERKPGSAQAELEELQISLRGINEKDSAPAGVLSAGSSRGSALKKNLREADFEIDTSYRTGESICGWVISVKSQGQHSLTGGNLSDQAKDSNNTPPAVKSFGLHSNKERSHSPGTGFSPSQKFFSVPAGDYKTAEKAVPLWINTNTPVDFESPNFAVGPNFKHSSHDPPARANFNSINHLSNMYWSCGVLQGIYSGSIQKFLSLLSGFPKNACKGGFKNPKAEFYENDIRDPWTQNPPYRRNKKKSQLTIVSLKAEKHELQEGLLLPRSLDTPYFAWGGFKKPDPIRLEWLVNHSKIQFSAPTGGRAAGKLFFTTALPPAGEDSKNSRATGKESFDSVNNPHSVPKVKTESNPLKIPRRDGDPTGARQRPHGDTISIYVAVAKPLQVGDKMSGRHGNKGIISKILPFYDMPYLIDGTPIDIVLNPLGVPSRMNVGQIYESLLGLTGFHKQEYYRIPPFDENYSSQFSRNFVYWKLNELKDLHFFRPTGDSQAVIKSYTSTNSNSITNPYRFPPAEFVSNAQTINCLTPWVLLGHPAHFYLPATPMTRKKHFYFNSRQISAVKSLNDFKITNSIRKNLSIKPLAQPVYENTAETLWWHSKLKRESSFNKVLPGNIADWNTELLGYVKSKILDPSNCLEPSKFSKVIHTNGINSKGKTKTKNWFAFAGGFESIQAKRWLSSKRIMNNFSFSKNSLWLSQQHSDQLLINPVRPAVEKFGLNPYFPGKMRLLNGLTGETFYRPIIVGKSYMLKLIHLVHHKIHARATGPYALITQQPLKGKRNQGGQRMGEMEIWALYGFGSASILYEMLTIKSDDPVGRERILREIAGLKGNPSGNSDGTVQEISSSLSLRESTRFRKNDSSLFGVPVNDSLEKGISESFRVLVMNLRALCLDMQVFKDLPS